MSRYPLVINGRILTAESELSLLENLERSGLRPEFHCREGFCGACAMTLISGESHYQQDPLAYIGDGKVLACCAYACELVELECPNLADQKPSAKS